MSPPTRVEPTVMVLPSVVMSDRSTGEGSGPAAQTGEKLRTAICTARKAVRSLREAEAREDSRCSFMGCSFPQIRIGPGR